MRKSGGRMDALLSATAKRKAATGARRWRSSLPLAAQALRAASRTGGTSARPPAASIAAAMAVACVSAPAARTRATRTPARRAMRTTKRKDWSVTSCRRSESIARATAVTFEIGSSMRARSYASTTGM
jgi:hypothetical protein